MNLTLLSNPRNNLDKEKMINSKFKCKQQANKYNHYKKGKKNKAKKYFKKKEKIRI